jgi:hypothetical protein
MLASEKSAPIHCHVEEEEEESDEVLIVEEEEELSFEAATALTFRSKILTSWDIKLTSASRQHIPRHWDSCIRVSLFVIREDEVHCKN